MSQSRITPDLLKEAGFAFLMDWPCDDQPIWLRTRAGPLMSVPYPLEINNSPMMLVRHHTAVDFERMVIDQFDEMLTSRSPPLICASRAHDGNGPALPAARIAPRVEVHRRSSAAAEDLVHPAG